MDEEKDATGGYFTAGQKLTEKVKDAFYSS
jgi:hypothetical protein